MTSTLLGIILVAYFVSAVLYLANLHVKHARFAVYATAAAVVGFVLQTMRLITVLVEDVSPFATPYESLILVAWGVVLLYLAILWRYKLNVVGALEMPLALICLLLAIAHKNVTVGSQVSGWLEVHVVAIIVSMALFAVAFCCSVMYLVQNKLLKSKKLMGMFRRLPPLELTDGLAHQLVALGFPLLTLGIITAVVSVYSGMLSEPVSAVKIAAAIITWATYGLYLVFYGAFGWRGRKTHYILLIGAVAVALTTAIHGKL